MSTPVQQNTAKARKLSMRDIVTRGQNESAAEIRFGEWALPYHQVSHSKAAHRWDNIAQGLRRPSVAVLMALDDMVKLGVISSAEKDAKIREYQLRHCAVSGRTA